MNKLRLAVLLITAMVSATAFTGCKEKEDKKVVLDSSFTQLEEIGNGFSGVEKTYAMQAGREVRVMVKPDMIDDATSYKIARDMKEQIEKEMQYPGTIKITVIRETRAQEEAK